MITFCSNTKEGRESFIIKSSFYILLYLNGNQLVITKGYKVRVTTIEGQNAFLLRRCALRKFHVIDGQNTRDKITSDRRSNRE